MAFGLGIIGGLVIAWVAFKPGASAERTNLAQQAAAAEANARGLAADLQRTREALRTAEAAAQRTRAVAQIEVVPNAPNAAIISTAPPAIIAPADTAILNYLGQPVHAPGDLDPRYSAAGLAAAFRGVCDAMGVAVDKLAVDTTEFPFVVHGRVERQPGNDFFRRVEAQLKETPGYKYVGSTTGHSKDGATYFAMSITPPAVYPRDDADAIQRRLMLRIQMIGEAWKDPSQDGDASRSPAAPAPGAGR